MLTVEFTFKENALGCSFALSLSLPVSLFTCARVGLRPPSLLLLVCLPTRFLAFLLTGSMISVIDVRQVTYDESS